MGLGHSRKGLGKGCISRKEICLRLGPGPKAGRTQDTGHSREDSVFMSVQGGLRSKIREDSGLCHSRKNPEIMSECWRLGVSITALEEQARLSYFYGSHP